MSATAAAGAQTFEILGETLTLPVEIRLARTDFAAFWVPVGPVAELIAGTGLVPAQPAPGKAVVTLIAAKYLDGDLGPYNEAGLAVMVRPHDSRPVSTGRNVAGFWRGEARAYIHELPVNQEFTLRAGRDIWGFPKWMADIGIEHGRRSTTCTLAEGGRDAWRLEIARGFGGFTARGTEMTAYSCTDATLRAVPWVTDNEGVRFRPGGARLELGDHPLADTLRSVGLPRRAAFCGSVEVFRATWGAALTC